MSDSPSPQRGEGWTQHLPGVIALAGLALAWSGWYDEGWFAADDGNYAHVASRILDGEVLHRDVQDVHTGYVNFTNAAAMALFGRSIVAMRAPLVLVNLVQAAIAYVVVARRSGPWAGTLATLALGVLTTPLFLNPTANVYCLFLTVVAIGIAELASDRPHRDIGLGVVVGLAMGFRQLSGVFLLAGVLAWRLQSPASAEGSPRLARASGVVVLAVLGGYLAKTADLSAWVLFGVGALGTVAAATIRANWSDKAWLGVLARLVLGGLAAAAPLVAYHAYHGSIREWVRDVVVIATGLPALSFFDSSSHVYSVLALRMVAHLDGGLGVTSFFSALGWTCLALAAVPVGIGTVRQLVRGAEVPPVAILAACWAPVSAHFGTPAYLSYTAGLSVVAWVVLGWPVRPLRPVVGATVVSLVSIFAVVHGGATAGRRFGAVLGGHREAHVSLDLPRAGIRVPAEQARQYQQLVAQIQAAVPSDRSILVLPSQADLYFLAERRNPTRFFNSALGLFAESDIDTAYAALSADPPVLVLWAPEDKYATPVAEAFMAKVTADYDRIEGGDELGLEIWRRRE